MAKTKTQSASSTSSSAAASSSYRSSRAEGPYSLTSFINFISNNFALLFIGGLLFLAGFLAGSVWTENQLLKGGKMLGGSGTAVAPTQPTAGAEAPTGPTPDQLAKVPKVTGDDYSRGNKNAKVTLIEYSDFECPFCARFHPTMLQVMEKYGDQINWVYRHYPLPFHPNAQKAAEASECVVAQKGPEGFWDFTDKIFEENNKLGGRLTPESITATAQATGVNMDAFKKCLDSGEMAAKVKEDEAGGSGAGITGTPGTIILTADGQAELIPGALPLEQVTAMLDKYVQ